MLNDTQIRTAKPAEKAYRLLDGQGLFLSVTPSGGKLWRMRYEIRGAEKVLSFGPYPKTSLVGARAERDKAKQLLREGRDPAVERKLRRLVGASGSANTFEAVAREWHEQQQHWSVKHRADVIDSLERDVFPLIGAIPVEELDAPAVLAVIRSIERRGAIETAHRVRQRMSCVFVHAIGSGRAKHDPATVVAGALSKIIRGRQPAITELEGARDILADVEKTPSHPVTRLAMRFLALTSVRPGELRGARWTEFEGLDGSEPIWRIPAERMKGTLERKAEHLVPLSTQAVAVLEEVRPLSGRFGYVFPSIRSARRPLSENALGYLLNRAGYHGRHVPHGWRAAFSSVMNERHRSDRHVIDLMLAHTPKDRVEKAYNRAEHMERRRELAQEWGDLLGSSPLPQPETD